MVVRWTRGLPSSGVPTGPFHKFSCGPFYICNCSHVCSPIPHAGSLRAGWWFTHLCIPKWKWSEVTQSCPTLCDPMDCSPPGSSVHRILQARIVEWVAISFSRESSQLRDQTQVSRIADRRFNLWATREAPVSPKSSTKKHFLNEQFKWMSEISPA